MKRRSVIIFATVFIIVLAAVLLSTQFAIKRESEIIVSTPIYEVSPVITDLKKWPDWFGGAGNYQFRLISSNPAGITVNAERAKIHSIYQISAYPDSISSRTRLKWITLISGFDWMKQKLGFIRDNPEARLDELRGYFENPKEFYGFDIRMGKVEDSLVLTTEKLVKKTELVTTLNLLFKKLEEFADREHLKTNIDSCRMATFFDETKDSVRVAAGIPISSRILAGEDGIRLLEMPPKGKILVGSYQGPYEGLSRLYGAMRRYVFDKKLVVIGAPYEKFLSQSSSSRDSLNMTIELHFPVL